MSKSRQNVDVSMLENLTIENAQNPRSRRKSPRINAKALAKIVSDVETNPTGEHGASSPVSVKNNYPRKSGPHSDNHHMAQQSMGYPPTKAKPKQRSKPKHTVAHYEPLAPLTAAEHTNVFCRFVLRPESHLTPYNINADTPIPSHFVWRLFSPPQDCPICLNAAEVPRMMSCGHVMCLHCMVQHARYSEQPHVCPICGDTVNTNTIRTTPVTFLHAENAFLPKDEEEVILTLMSRPTNSALALPIDIENPKRRRHSKFPSPENILWTRVCQSSLEYAKTELSKELKYLIGASKRSVEEYGSDEGYNDGIAEIKRYLQTLNAQYESSNPNSSSDVSTTSSANSHSHPSPGHSSHGHSHNTHHQQSNSKSLTKSHIPDADTVYFYQTAFESSTVYTLDLLDVTILKHAFGEPENFPSTLMAKVENIEHTVYDRLRDKRLKYLSHLPEQTPLAFMECDWTGVLHPEVLEKFATKLAERRRSKRRKQAQDLAERRKAEASIERQFQLEVAEAMLPHTDVDLADSAGIDTAQLPSLPRNTPTPAAATTAKSWVDEAKVRDEIFKNAYVTKKGRKEVILRF